MNIGKLIDTLPKEEQDKFYMKNYREKNKEKIREQRKKYRQENKEKIKIYNQEWRKKNPEKVKEVSKRTSKKYLKNHPEIAKAHKLTQKFKIPKGELCSNCKINKAIEKHHPDYSKPRHIMFLCRECHYKIHRREL